LLITNLQDEKMKIYKHIDSDGMGWAYGIDFTTVRIIPETLVLYSVTDGYITGYEDFYLCNDLNELIQLLRTFSVAVKNKNLRTKNGDDEYSHDEMLIQEEFNKYRKIFTEYTALFTEPYDKKVVEDFNDKFEKSKIDIAYGRQFQDSCDEFIAFYCMGNIQSALTDDNFQDCIRTAISVMRNGEFDSYKNLDSKMKEKIEKLLENDEIEQYIFQSPKDDDLILYAIREIQDGALVV